MPGRMLNACIKYMCNTSGLHMVRIQMCVKVSASTSTSTCGSVYIDVHKMFLP